MPIWRPAFDTSSRIDCGSDRRAFSGAIPVKKPERIDATRVAELLAELRALFANEMSNVNQQWDRGLPFADYIVDRWQKARDLGFAEGCSIYDSALVLGNVQVGTNTWIGPFTVLDGSGGLEIGDTCSISAGVQIYTHDTIAWATSGGAAAVARAPVRIGSRCYIGPNSVISKGVTIGDGCVIGANSLVSCNVPSGMKAWGTPCRLQGQTE
jgi:acetyltransferase-like isoleucine patch superfamily enzyme